jgi:hypothetical protein
MKQSLYQQRGSPRVCHLPGCNNRFQGTAFRGDDGNFYCSRECAEKAETLDLTQVEKIALKAR